MMIMPYNTEMKNAFIIKTRNSADDNYMYYHITCYASGKRDLNKGNILLSSKKFTNKQCNDCGKDINKNPRDFLKYSKCAKKNCVHKYSNGKTCAMCRCRTAFKN